MDISDKKIEAVLEQLQKDGIIKIKEGVISPNSEVDISSLVKLIKPNDDKEEDFCDYSKCKECGGICCSHMGCHLAPSDLVNIDKQTLKELLDTGLVSIDWWDGLYVEEDGYSGNGYYLRIRNILSNIVDPSDGGRCGLLTDKGCLLDFKHRPKGGRQLPTSTCRIDISKEEYEEKAYTKFKCVMDWHPYTDMLEELHDEYEDK